MGKPDQESAAEEEARRATGDAAGRGRGGRLSARRKRETVLRLLRGEDLESVSRELGITAARGAQWRDQFLAAGHLAGRGRAVDRRRPPLPGVLGTRQAADRLRAGIDA